MDLTERPNFVLDTNIALYLLGDRLSEPLPKGRYFASVIAEMELLSFPQLSDSEEQRIRAFLQQLQLVQLTEAVRTSAIRLRRQHGLKLPDAIIAATSFASDATLLTNDLRLVNLPSLQTRSMNLKK